MNETMPISAGLPAGMTTDACLEAQLRSAFLTGETDGEEAGLRPEFVINDPDRRIKVLTVIEDELARCTSFDISVAFVTMSGIEPLLPIFEELRERGVPGRVLTTDYLGFSDPAAMRKLAGISNIEVRLFRTEGNRGFHTKGYIFNSGDVCRFLIGSSNLTGTALATNREWNARLVSKQTGAFARALQAEFKALGAHPLSRPLHDVIDAYEAERRAKQERRRELTEQLAASRALVDFTQGLDIRLTNPDNIALLNKVRTKAVHFAWDNPEEDLTEHFRRFVAHTAIRSDRNRRVYVLTNYGSTHEQDLYRVNTLRALGYDPYVMIYERPTAPKITRHLQRWVNNKRIFHTVKDFKDYAPMKKEVH